MTNQYGPWATLIDAGPNPQLSAFWRRRLVMLGPTSQTSPVLSRRNLLWLGAAAVLTSVLPMFHTVAAVAEQRKTMEESTIAQAKQLDILRVESVKQTISDEGRKRVIAFVVYIPKGERFRVSFAETPMRKYAETGRVLENEREGPARVEVTFTYRKDPREDVLLGRHEEVEFSVDSQDCYGGFTTIAGLPLGNLSPGAKQVVLVKSEEDWGAIAPNGRRLLLIYPSAQSGKEFGSTEPRGELTVSREPKPQYNAEDRTPPAEKLVSLWWRQQREIGTAHIKYRLFRRGNDFLSLTPDEVSKVLAEAKLDERPQDVMQVVSRLLQDKSLAEKSWGVKDFWCVGLKTRENTSSGRLRLDDGEVDIAYDPVNHQVNVHKTGHSRVRRTTLSDFRLTGNPARIGDDKTTIRVDPNDQAIVDMGNRELVVDMTTGFIRSLVWRGQDADILRTDCQYHPVKYPGNIVFPTVRARFTYRSGRLASADFLVVDSARFNEDFPADAFKVTLPAQTLLVDYRQDDFRPRIRRLGKAISDIATYLGEAN